MPALGSFNLVAPAPANDPYDVLRNGNTIHIEGTNIQAEANDDYTGSVVFFLNGDRRQDNTYPFSLFGDLDGNYNKGTLENGNYTLTAIAYPQENGAGTPGDTATVSFSVDNTYSTQATVYPNPVQSSSIIEVHGPANSPVRIDLVEENHASHQYTIYDGVTDQTGSLQRPISSLNLTRGLYILLVHINGRVIQKRLIVE